MFYGNPTKKSSKNKKAKARSTAAKTSQAKEAQTIAELRQQLAELGRELQDGKRQRSEDLEQKTATSDILRVIASSPADIQPVLNVVAENAARLCDAADAQIFRIAGSECRIVASHGSIPVPRRHELTHHRRAAFDQSHDRPRSDTCP